MKANGLDRQSFPVNILLFAGGHRRRSFHPYKCRRRSTVPFVLAETMYILVIVAFYSRHYRVKELIELCCMLFDPLNYFIADIILQRNVDYLLIYYMEPLARVQRFPDALAQRLSGNRSCISAVVVHLSAHMN